MKLGSLYKNPNNDTDDYSKSISLQQNLSEQERRMLDEEQKQWARLSPNPSELQV